MLGLVIALVVLQSISLVFTIGACGALSVIKTNSEHERLKWQGAPRG